MTDDKVVPLRDEFAVQHKGQSGIVRFNSVTGKYEWATVVDKRYSVKGIEVSAEEARKRITQSIDDLTAGGDVAGDD